MYQRAIMLAEAHDAIDVELVRMRHIWSANFMKPRVLKRSESGTSLSHTGNNTESGPDPHPADETALHLGSRILDSIGESKADAHSIQSEMDSDTTRSGTSLEKEAQTQPQNLPGARHLRSLDFSHARMACNVSKVRARGKLWCGVVGLTVPVGDVANRSHAPDEAPTGLQTNQGHPLPCDRFNKRGKLGQRFYAGLSVVAALQFSANVIARIRSLSNKFGVKMFASVGIDISPPSVIGLLGLR